MTSSVSLVARALKHWAKLFFFNQSMTKAHLRGKFTNFEIASLDEFS